MNCMQTRAQPTVCCHVAGDYTGSQPCTSNVFDGQTIQVYDPTQLVGNNDEVVW